MKAAWRNALAMLLWVASSPVFSQPYPTKPIRIVVPFTAGSASDILARFVGPKFYETWGQQVVVDNRSSAGGTVAGGIVATATPDGHTLMLTSSAFAGSAALYDKLPYDSIRDFSGVSQVAATALVIVVSPAMGAKTLKELIALAKQKPKQFNFASSGIGSGTHYGSELFNMAAGISAVHVPYKGVPEAVNDTLTGRIHYFVTPLLPTISLIQNGRLLALAVTTTQRVPMLPDVPTVAEAALPGFEYDGWFGIFAPSKTPRAIIAKLNKEVVRILETTDVRDKILKQGATAKASTPEAFDKLVREEIVTRRKVFSAAGIKPE
ncbi:MAG TPA: tripartite tricarboxylate transporter substrate binding protein [Burkholderiales bacterium]|nr:tripartite tricarboxylate transporter substrate binding protein [Burkholderiales bacterium]